MPPLVYSYIYKQPQTFSDLPLFLLSLLMHMFYKGPVERPHFNVSDPLYNNNDNWTTGGFVRRSVAELEPGCSSQADISPVRKGEGYADPRRRGRGGWHWC